MGMTRKVAPTPRFKMRRCMNPACRKQFLSDHNGIRFCNKCKSQLCNHYFDEPHRVYL